MPATVDAKKRKAELLGLSEMLALQVIAAILLIGFHFVSARLLTTEVYGVLSFGLNIAGLLALFCALGYPDLVMRQVAAAKSLGQWGLLKGVTTQATRSTLLLSILVAGVLAVLPLAGRLIDNEQGVGLRIAAVAVLFYPLGFVRARLARGLGTIRCSIIPEDVIRPAVFIAVLWVVVAGFGVQAGGTELLIILATALLSSMAAGVLCLHRGAPFSWRTTSAEYRPVEWQRSSRQMMMGGLFQEVLLRSDLIALGIFAGMAPTAQFSVCSKVALLNVFVLKVVDSYFAPQIAVAFNSGNRHGVRRLVVRTAVLSLAGSLPVALLLIFFPEVFLSPFGSDYVAATLPLQILAAGTLVNAATGATGSALLMTNNEGSFARIAIGIAVTNVLAHALFTPTFGIVGAAVITSTSVAAQNLIMAWVVYNRFFRNG